jgi:hypothetical protein
MQRSSRGAPFEYLRPMTHRLRKALILEECDTLRDGCILNPVIVAKAEAGAPLSTCHQLNVGHAKHTLQQCKLTLGDLGT